MKLSEFIKKYGDCEVSQDLLDMITEKDWKPKNGENYYYIGTFHDVCPTANYEQETDNLLFETGNFYKTIEEAEKVIEIYNFCKERSFKPNWEDEHEKKYTLILQLDDKKVTWCDSTICHGFEPFYYPTRMIVREIADKYSFEELAKYYGKLR